MNIQEIKEKALKLITVRCNIVLTAQEEKAAIFLSETDFGCQDNNVNSLVEAWFGHPLSLNRNILTLIKGIFVVPLNNLNGHNYDVGETTFIVASNNNSTHGIGINTTNDVGNNLRSDTGCHVRSSTPEEIDEFLTEATNKTIKHIVSILESITL